jgi:hypothetical protein
MSSRFDVQLAVVLAVIWPLANDADPAKAKKRVKSFIFPERV